MNYRKVLVILAVLIALPFSLKVKAGDDFEVITLSIPEDALWRSENPCDTFVVYYIDTSWEVTKRDSSAYIPDIDPWPAFGHQDRWVITVTYTPVLDTIIIGRFWTDADTKRIKDWQVMEAK